MASELRMVMISYNEAIDDDVIDILKNCNIKNYTKIVGTFGSGNSSGIHLGDDIWPGRNNILYIACEEAVARQLMIAVKEVRKKLSKEGIKAFILPLEEIS